MCSLTQAQASTVRCLCALNTPAAVAHGNSNIYTVSMTELQCKPCRQCLKQWQLQSPSMHTPTIPTFQHRIIVPRTQSPTINNKKRTLTPHASDRWPMRRVGGLERGVCGDAARGASCTKKQSAVRTRPIRATFTMKPAAAAANSTHGNMDRAHHN